MTPIWSATSKRPEPSPSGASVVGEVKPSATSLRPTPDLVSAATAESAASIRRQIETSKTSARTKGLVFTRRTVSHFQAITRSLQRELMDGAELRTRKAAGVMPLSGPGADGFLSG